MQEACGMQGKGVGQAMGWPGEGALDSAPSGQKDSRGQWGEAC